MARSLVERDRIAVLGDLAEEFSALAAQDGVRAARRWYWRQTLASLTPNLRRRLQRHAPARQHSPGGSLMDSLWQDARFGWRSLRQRPLVTTVALLSLVVGISMSTVVFSLLDAAVLSPLPLRQPDRLALVLSRRAEGTNHNFSYPDFADYRAGQHTFTDLVAYSGAAVTMRQPSGAAVVDAELVSGGFFAGLGVPMRAGRGLGDADDRPDAAPVVVVSEALWHVVAPGVASFEPRSIRVNDRDFAIVGIADGSFHGMNIGGDVRLWAALNQQPVLNPLGGQSLVPRRTVSWLSVMGRLRPGVTLETAAADLNRIEAMLGPAVSRPEQRTLLLEPGQQGDSSLPKATASPLQLLLGAALLVLLVACANVANLLVSRSADRSRELAVRTALGASRGRIARLLLIEAVLLGAIGSAAGLLAARWLARLAVPLFTAFGRPVAFDLALNWRVLLFVIAAGFSATAIAGLAPILSGRTAPAGALGEGGRAASPGRSAARMRRGLVVVQFALSLALVSSATLLVRTLANLRSIPTGLDLDHVALLEVNPEGAPYNPTRIRQYLDDAATRLRGVPGVRAVGYGRVLPLGFGGSRATVFIPGYQPRPDEDMELNYNVVSPEYFETLGLTLVAGRLVTDADVLGQPLAAVVNETMARRYWPNGPAVGREMHFGDDKGPLFQIVGVVRDVKYRMLREEAGPSFYYSVRQSARPHGGVLHVRTAGDPAALVETLRRALAGLDPAVPVMMARTLRDQVSLNVNDDRVAMTIGLALALAALLLAAVGLYGAMSYSVAQRTREIGVRLALGAVPRHIRGIVIGQGLRLALVGSGLGVVLGVWLGRLIEARLYGVTPGDVTSFALSAGVLTSVALVASWAPARRAMRVDPVEALRMD
jgi:predicted permease